MRHRDLLFTGVQFFDDATTSPPRITQLVLDVLCIDYYCVCKDESWPSKRPLLELHLKSGARVYVADLTLEDVGKLRRHAMAVDMSASRFTDN